MKNFVEELRWRGMLQDMMPGTEEQLMKEPTAAYLGIDPTADSLHIGHLCGIMMLKHLQNAGHKPIALIGGATGMIGDPSGKSAERNLLDEPTFFYTYMRPLVEAGKLYRAVTPLYIIRQKGKEFYCYSEEELDEWKKTHKGSYDLLRAKGLGELNAEDLQKVCFLNERYKRITISDIEQSTALLNVLQGPSVEPRKKFIYENATELGFNFD